LSNNNNLNVSNN